MKALIAAAFDRSRTVLVALLLITLWGAVVAWDIPKEADPDVQLPVVYVSLFHEGIAPEDAERLLVRPVERELQSLEGLKEMRSTSSAIVSTACSMRCSCSPIKGDSDVEAPLRSSRRPHARASGHPMTITAAMA